MMSTLFVAPLLVAAAGLAAAEEVPASNPPNRLINESSPYLLLHAHNPVDWYPWGEEAFAAAREQGRPIFLSVGYSTCYWCHVMEREVFSDPEIAALMNDWFINIKVDREERPDIDEIYMMTTQLLTGHGGWPNSVFLTPELEPFYAGTYFPPEDRQGLPGFPTVLKAINRAWQEQPSQVFDQAHRITAGVVEIMQGSSQEHSDPVAPEAVDAVIEELRKGFDREFGGFGQAPKFPSPGNLFLLWEVARGGDLEARQMVLETLRHMGRGAIFDHLEGGFHRYTLDREWRVPHFEKMLYDNALLAELLVVAAAASADPELERLARGSLDFLLERMQLPNGAFKSAIDAETDGEEGAFYVWSRPEVEEVLGRQDFELLAPVFGFSAAPNFEHDRYTLYLSDSLESHAARLEMSRQQLIIRLEPLLGRLREARALRPFPLVDDKVLTDWNGMVISAMARAGETFNDPRYLTAAADAADFLLQQRNDQGIQLHVWRQGEARVPAFLDDYAFLVRGLITLHRVTGEERWLLEAERLTVEMMQRLSDPRGGFFTGAADSSLLVRARVVTDSAIPSGNGVAALDLLQLSDLTGKPLYRAKAELALRTFGPDLVRIPAAMSTVALAARWVIDHPGDGVIGQTAGAMSAAAAEKVVLARLEIDSKASSGWSAFTVELEIEAGWHVNANPASSEFLIPTTIEGDVRDLVYPAGEEMEFAFAAERLRVISGKAVIRGWVNADSDQVDLTYQACDERRCLAPVTRNLKVSL